MPVDRFASLTAFLAVAEEGGFARAARRLGLSPSAVTRLVGALEARLGVRLLHRTTRALHLTGAGERFRERARRALAELEEAERAAEEERDGPSGRVAVTAPLVFGRLHLAPLLAAFSAAHPRVEVELLLGDRFLNLAEEGVDLALRVGALRDSSEVARRVGRTGRLLVASPAYLARAGAPEDPAALARHRLIATTATGPARGWRLARGAEVPVAAAAFRTNSVDAAIAYAVAGGGIASAFGYQVAAQLADGTLVRLLEGWEPEPVPIHLVTPGGGPMPAKLRALMDFVAAARRWEF
jgi:DNA-binding transcriptional LysR family regulator